MGFTHRAGSLRLILVLPDGTRSLVPADWTDLDLQPGNPAPPPEPGRSPSRPCTLGFLRDLLRARTIVDALLRRLTCFNDGQCPSDRKEDEHATETRLSGVAGSDHPRGKRTRSRSAKSVRSRAGKSDRTGHLPSTERGCPGGSR